MSEPIQKPGRSKQDYCTPLGFFDAVRRHFGPIDVDLAAADDRLCKEWIGPITDALNLDVAWWSILRERTGWLNPPFGDLRPWAARCTSEARLGARIIMLTPASLGAEWYCDEVQGHALTLVVRPRLTFVGCTAPYPKDCAIHLFGFGMVGLGTWRWK